MRLDVVSIFPDYLAPLDLSLIGKARRDGLLDVRVHDLRDFAHDRHRTVDDTPYGGGAGMVMKPEPWAEALDAVVASAEDATAVPHLVVPGPGGVPFSQALARDLAREPWLAFACGRYEGIDERVLEHAADRMPVTVVSLGDYVLNGGEVAVLAVVEAVARLLPGVIGNAESLVEESHEDGLLEYPVYTKPAVWHDGDTDRAVPGVLLSGDHARVAAWRHAQRLQRTAARRPDLLHASSAVAGLGDLRLSRATAADGPELLVLQRACWLAEARANDTFDIPALVEDLPTVRAGIAEWTTYVAREPTTGRLVGSVRGLLQDDGSRWDIGRLMVAPDLQGRGLGRALLAFVEGLAPASVRRHSLLTGAASVGNQRMYKRAGYRVRRDLAGPAGTLTLTKERRA